MTFEEIYTKAIDEIAYSDQLEQCLGSLEQGL